MRSSNILLTHDFVPIGDDSHQTRIIGTFEYLAPEYTKQEILNIKYSQEFKKEFLWAEASLVELKLVLIHKSLINVEILQLFLDMVGANLMMLAGNSMTWDPGGWSLVHWRSQHV